MNQLTWALSDLVEICECVVYFSMAPVYIYMYKIADLGLVIIFAIFIEVIGETAIVGVM